MTICIEYEAQDVLSLDYETVIRSVVKEALEYEACPFEACVNILLTDDEAVREINAQYRGIDKPTDVLSFPMVDYEEAGQFSHLSKVSESYFDLDTGELVLGDIIISVDKVREQAEAYGHSECRELAFLTAHSMLHLMGYDHIDENEREAMEIRQREVLDKLGYKR